MSFDSTICTCCRLYEELTGVNDEIGDLEDRLAALKDKAESLGKEVRSGQEGL